MSTPLRRNAKILNNEDAIEVLKTIQLVSCVFIHIKNYDKAEGLSLNR